MGRILQKFCVLILLLLIVFMFGAFFVLDSNAEDVDNDKSQSGNVPQTIDWSNLYVSCLGDSITLGDYLSYPYPTLLKNELGVAKVDNLGISGNCCAYLRADLDPMCERYTEISSKSDIIVVMCGVNDAYQVELGTIDDKSNTTFYGALNILCAGLKEKYPDAWVFFMTSFDFDISEELNKFDTQYKSYYFTAVKKVCRKYDIDVFDTFSYFEIDDESEFIGVHPRQAFVSNRWVPAIAQYIKANYSGKTA